MGYKILKYSIVLIAILIIGSGVYIFRDSIFIDDKTSIDDNQDAPKNKTHDPHPCNQDFNLEDVIKMEEEGPNSFPDVKENVAYIRPLDGHGLDYKRDRYLYRWLVAESYNASVSDFYQKYTEFNNSYNEYQLFTEGDPNKQRHLRIEEQYLSLSNSYCNEALVPWNSEYGGLIGSTDTIDARVTNIGSLVPNSASGFRDINEQPVLHAKFTENLTQGYIQYDSYWVNEDKANIEANSIQMSHLQDVLNQIPIDDNTSRFGNISSVNPNSISRIWGLDSLPGGINYIDRTDPKALDFVSKYDSYDDLLISNPNITTYDFIQEVYADIECFVYQGIQDGSFNIDPTETSGVASPGADKAYWFYTSLEDPSMQSGIKEVMTGFTHMLRSFGIPSRPVIGFSVGEFYSDGGTPGLDDSATIDDVECFSNGCDYIKLRFEHIHVWVEALIPVILKGKTTYHWGIFNPIPDPWIMQNDNSDLEYGRNSLGKGKPEVEIEITSGENTNLMSPIGLESIGFHETIKVQTKGYDLEGRVRITYDGIPYPGELVELRLISESKLFSGDITPDMGIPFSSVVTGVDGWGTFKLFVDLDGQVFTYDENSVRNSSAIENLNIAELDTLHSPTGLYGIIAFHRHSLGGTILGWSLNAEFQLTANTSIVTMINPNKGSVINAYNVTLGHTAQFTIEVSQNVTTSYPLQGISDIDLILLTEDDYSTLIAALSIDIFDSNLIQNNWIGTFPTTDVDGKSNLNITFDQQFIDTFGKSVNEVYVVVALRQSNHTFSLDPVFVWFDGM